MNNYLRIESGSRKAVFRSAIGGLIIALVLCACLPDHDNSVSADYEKESAQTTAYTEAYDANIPTYVAAPIQRDFIPDYVVEGIVEASKPVESENKSDILYYDVPLSNDMQDYIRQVLSDNELPENHFEIILAMMHVESRFKTDVSNGNCIGILQVSTIHKDRLEELGVSDLTNPEQCILAGISIYKDGYSLGVDLEPTIDDHGMSSEDFIINVALMSYNTGYYGTKDLVADGIYSTRYVEKVREAIDELEVKTES